MSNTSIDRILQNMLHIMPFFHRKLLRMDLGGVTGNLTRLHFAIMGILSEHTLTVTELARILTITKPQMTHLIDRLVRLGFVERCPDEVDRRVIHLILTDNGRIMLEDMKQKVKDNIRNRLSSLTAEELDEMLAALEKLREIGAKL